MKISRRHFLKWSTISATSMGLSSFELNRLENIALAMEGNPPVIWLQGSGCSGCSISLMNSIEETTIDDLLLNKISMKYHQNIMTAAGDLAISAIDETVTQYNDQFILVIEGAIPTGNNGTYCILTEKDGKPWTMLDAVKELGPKANYVIAAGTCASFGGAPKAGSNPTGVMRLDEILKDQTKNKIINLPGCPVHPYTMTKTIIDLLLYGTPKLDKDGRPEIHYKEKIHGLCPRRGKGQATQLGEYGCLKSQGCEGPKTNNNCPTRKWNNKVNWCIEAGQPCIMCASKEFLSRPIYKFD